MAKRTERDRQREETRRKVYEAALEVFKSDSVDGAKIDDIARMAGVSRGTFYFHFPTKDDVLLEHLAVMEQELVETLDGLDEDTEIQEVLEAVAGGMAAQWAEDSTLLPAVGTVAMKITSQGLDRVKDAHPVLESLEDRFGTAMEREQIDGLLPAELLSQYFLINLFAAALAWCGAPMMPLDDLLKNVVVFFLRSARPPG